jgi:hypothetical protein
MSSLEWLVLLKTKLRECECERELELGFNSQSISLKIDSYLHCVRSSKIIRKFMFNKEAHTAAAGPSDSLLVN